MTLSGMGLLGVPPSALARWTAYISNMRIRYALLVYLSWTLFACGLARASDLALVGGKIYASPDEAPIENGSIVVHDGHIVAVGPSNTVKVPREATVIE